MVSKLDHLNLSVHDFDQSVAWYGLVFGFNLVEEGLSEGVRWGILRAADALLCIYEHPNWQCPDNDNRRSQGLHGISHFGLRISDRQTWEETIQREKIKLYYGGKVQYPHSTSWYIKDPTGYEIEVAYWDHNHVMFQ